MKKIFQVGAGLVGKTMALDLSKEYQVHLGDSNLDLFMNPGRNSSVGLKYEF